MVVDTGDVDREYEPGRGGALTFLDDAEGEDDVYREFECRLALSFSVTSIFF